MMPVRRDDITRFRAIVWVQAAVCAGACGLALGASQDVSEPTKLDLTDEQESKLLGIISSTSAKALDHFEAGVEIDRSVSGVIQSLSMAVSGIS